MFYTGKPKSRFAKRFVSVYVVIALLFVVFGAGWYLGDTYGADGQPAAGAEVESGEVKDKDDLPPYLLEDVDFNLFWDVWNIAKDKYLEQPVFDTRLFYGALEGLVASLGDPYSVFLNPETTRQFTDELSGTFEGIGAEIGIKKEQLVVIASLPDAPAERAGLRSGDFIVKIEDLDTRGMPLDVAVSKIRGPKGETVTLTVFREGWKEAREIPIVRDTINVKSVRVEELGNGLAHVKIIYFNETTPMLFVEAVQTLLAKDAKGIILDLRNNPGGFLETAVSVASEWVAPNEIIVTQEFQGGRQEHFRSEGPARLRGIPTAVLVNEGSASASEIVAGALKDYGAATLVGAKTFGKGSVQTYEQLRGGSSVKLTVAHWLTPKGSQINGQGIAPDYEVELTDEDYNNDRDPQLQKAIELLKSL